MRVIMAGDYSAAAGGQGKTVWTAPAGPATFSFDPASISQAKGSTFAVNVMLTGAQNAYSVPLQISYDPKAAIAAGIAAAEARLGKDDD